MPILRIAGFVLLLCLWGYSVYCCIKAVRNLSSAVSKTKYSHMRGFPSGEIHPLLRMDGNSNIKHEVVRIDEAGNRDSGLLSGFPDAEEEKRYPYYNRTGRIVCNLKTESKERISSGSWYGYPQWIQDVIAGISDDNCFEINSSTDGGKTDE